MKKIYLFISLFLWAFNAYSQVVISEVMYNPPESGTDSLEYIELQNVGSQPVQMQGWRFAQGINFTFEDFTLGAGEFVVIAVNLVAFQEVFGTDITVFQMGLNSALNNAGEPITLVNSNNFAMSQLTYSNAAGGWYNEADGNGASIELCNPMKVINDISNWRPSTNDTWIIINGKNIFGTPGAANSAECEVEPDVIVEVGDTFFAPATITIQTGETVSWINKGWIQNVNGSQSAFPGNPVSFHSGNASSAEWTYQFTFLIAGIYNYKSDLHSDDILGTINVLQGEEVIIPTYSIGQINDTNSEGVADSLGVEAYVEGIIYGVNQRDPGLQYTLIDNDGNGIGLFNPSASFVTLEEGDLVRVRGVVEQFRGLTQLNISELEVLSTGNSPVDPVLVQELNEETESRLVQLVSLTVVDPSQWTNNPVGFNVTVTNGTNNFTMRIARNVNSGFTEAPVGTFDLVGIGGQFSTNANTPPFNDGYQILPRYAADFDLRVSVQDENFYSQVNVFPTIATERIFIDSQVPLQKVEMFNSFSKMILFKDLKGLNNQWLEVNNLAPGTYILHIIGAENQLITKKIIINK